MTYLSKVQILAFVLLFLASCANTSPKKEKQWQVYEETDFRLEHLAESDIEVVPTEEGTDVWFNISYSDVDATIHCSYLSVDSLTLKGVLADAKRLAYRQKPLSSDIKEEKVEDGISINSGLIYVLSGRVATPLQFYVTDNQKHFLRGSLYIAPNESLEPDSKTIKSIKEDITHLITTIRWGS